MKTILLIGILAGAMTAAIPPLDALNYIGGLCALVQAFLLGVEIGITA